MRSLKHLVLVLSIAWMALSSSVHGQPTDERWFLFRYDNDFFTATDQYFTQGIRLELAATFISRSPLRSLLPRSGKNALQLDALYAQQECFTPTSIRRDTIVLTDRPFAAALYIGQRSISTDTERKRRLTANIDLGVIGPCAICAEEQRGIHKALNNIEPLGWQFQVANDVILNYGVQLDQRLFRHRFAEISGGIAFAAGTFRTHASLNMRAEVGLFQSLVDSPGSFAKKLQFSLFLQGEMRFVGHDATFQGGVFEHDSPHVLANRIMERVVLFAEGGFNFRFRSLALSYRKSFITRQFTSGRDHAWGSCVITGYF